MLLATPDFGAGAVLGCFLLLVFVTVIFLVCTGIRVTLRRFCSDDHRIRRKGVKWLLFTCLLPLAVWEFPTLLYYCQYGNFPLRTKPSESQIKLGMTQAEVIASIGKPYDRIRYQNEEAWYYYIDSLGQNTFRISFGLNGQVQSTSENIY